MHIINTQAGNFEVKIISSDNLYLRGVATIRRKSIEISASFFKWSDGQWHLGMEKQSVYEQMYFNLNKHDSLKEMTPTYRRDLVLVITPPVNRLVEDEHFQRAMEDQDRENRKAGIHNRQYLVRKMNKLTLALKGEIKQLEAGENLPICTTLSTDLM